MKQIKLVLETGEEYLGESVGFDIDSMFSLGELVFNTSMTGYQEILSDPSYCDQIVVMTYPLIGNYGVNKDDFESLSPALNGMVVRECAEEGSNWRNEYSLRELLKRFKVPARRRKTHCHDGFWLQKKHPSLSFKKRLRRRCSALECLG